MRSDLWLGFVACVACAACDNTTPPADAGPCWPPANAVPGGQVTIGTGDISWQAMPAMLAIVANGSQSDPFLQIHSRIRGMPPGNANDPFDPANPKTLVSATIPDLGITLGVSCPATIGYVTSPDDPTSFDLLHSLRIGIGTQPIASVVGHQATLTVEVAGSNGLLAMDSKTVMLIQMPAPVDAGVVDAP